MMRDFSRSEDKISFSQDCRAVPDKESDFARQNQKRLIFIVVEMRGRPGPGSESSFHHCVFLSRGSAIEKNGDTISGD
jgi:hypothetical protein